MRLLSILFLTLFFCISANCQIDSSWLADNYLSRFYKDTGTYLQSASFLDEAGKEKTLSDFKGKILYIDMWSTTCGPCIAKFPHQEQLLKRLKALDLDSTVLFVNINAEDSKNKWKKGLRKYHPNGVNLYSSDTSLYTRWNVDALPCYMLLDSSGKVLGKCIIGPDDGSIDWVLYSATKGIHPVEAILRMFAQNKLMSQYHSAAAFTDPEYAKWYERSMPGLVEYFKWRKERQPKNFGKP
jgi:thiol-disulfide isomerase/thioredoxin